MNELPPPQYPTCERAQSARQHFDFAIDAGDDLKVALIGPALVARDDVVLALCEHQPRKGADRFFDHVAARGTHRPLRIGESLAAWIVHQLESDDRGAMRYYNIGQLAGLDTDDGADNRIALAIVGENVIRAFWNQHDITCEHVLRDRSPFVGVELAASKNLERYVPRRDAHVAYPTFEPNAAGRDIEDFAHRVRAQLDCLGGTGKAKACMHDVVARR